MSNLEHKLSTKRRAWAFSERSIEDWYRRIALSTLFFICLLLLSSNRLALAETYLVTSAEIAQGPQTSKSATNAVWHSVGLSDVWRRQSTCREGIWTYRISLAVSPVEDDLAFLIYRAGNRLSVYVDDEFIERFGELADPDVDFSNHALLVNVPTSLVKNKEQSHIYIQVAGDCRRYSGLSQILFGKRNEIATVHSTQVNTFFITNVTVIVVCAILAFVSLSSAILYRSTNAFLFGIASGLWALRAWLWSMNALPISYSIWFFLIDLCYGVWMSLICVLALRINKIGSRWLENLQWLSLFVFLSSSVALVFGAPPALKGFGIDFTVLAGALALISVAVQCFRKPSPSNIAVALAGTVMLVLGLYDHWNVWISSAPDAYQRFYLTPVIVLFFILAIGVVLNLQYMRAIRSDAQYKRVLESEVERQRDILEQHHRQLATQAQKEAVNQERVRIMKDMHDGLGSQLIGLMSLVRTAPEQKTEIEFELQQALDTLRATIDTLSPSGDDLTTVLAQFRFRHESRLKRLQIQLHWRVSPFETGNWPSSRLLQFEQIIREVFANIIKHARATEIFVEAGTREKQNFLTITDNGCGFDQNIFHRGRGIQHLIERAEELEIQLTVESEVGKGTTVRLLW